jgi:hypothetical protein
MEAQERVKNFYYIVYMKTCRICKLEKEDTEFGYRSSARSKLSTFCKMCQEEARLTFAAENPYRYCKFCEKEKSILDFPRVNGLRGFAYKCNTCNNARTRTYRDANPDKAKAYRKKDDYSEKRKIPRKTAIVANPLSAMLSRAKSRAKLKGREFDISVEDLSIPEFCPLLGIPLFVGTKGQYINAPSIDRIDSTKGYIKGNVWVISSLANTMKNQASIDQLKAFAHNILKIL